jgi:hypothetical protein
MNKLQQALALLERFERGEFIQPSEAESLLVQVFEACGEFCDRQPSRDPFKQIAAYFRTGSSELRPLRSSVTSAVCTQLFLGAPSRLFDQWTGEQ